MAIMRHGDAPSTKLVKDDYGKVTEMTNDLAKPDKSKVPYGGIADSFPYDSATGSKAKSD